MAACKAAGTSNRPPPPFAIADFRFSDCRLTPQVGQGRALGATNLQSEINNLKFSCRAPNNAIADFRFQIAD
jgi:hypothetical protein